MTSLASLLYRRLVIHTKPPEKVQMVNLPPTIKFKSLRNLLDCSARQAQARLRTYYLSSQRRKGYCMRHWANGLYTARVSWSGTIFERYDICKIFCQQNGRRIEPNAISFLKRRWRPISTRFKDHSQRKRDLQVLQHQKIFLRLFQPFSLRIHR